MGRKQTQEERVDHSKARKEQKIQKAAGTFKKSIYLYIQFPINLISHLIYPNLNKKMYKAF